MQHRAVIIDDEQKSRAALKAEIEDYCPIITVVGEADGVQSGIGLIKQVSPDVVFLDIQMNDGTGFDLLKHFPQVPFQIVFVTAFDQYAIRAFKFSAVDYLLKPINSDDLIEAVNKLSIISSQKNLMKSLEVLFENTNQKKSNKIVLGTSEGLSVHKISEIIRVEADSNYSKVCFLNEPPITVSKTLKEFEEILSNHSFERVHQSHLLNIDHIKKFSSKEGSHILMSDETVVPVSQRKKIHIRKLLESL